MVPPSATEETGWELPRSPLYKDKVQTSAVDRSSAGTGAAETSPGGEGSGEPRRESEMEAVLLAAMDAPPPPKGKAGPAGGQAGMAPPLFDMLDLTDATPPARQGRSPSPHPRAGGDVGTLGPVRQQLAATTTMTRSGKLTLKHGSYACTSTLVPTPSDRVSWHVPVSRSSQYQMLFANCHADFSRLHIWFKNTRLVKQLIEQHLPVPYPPHIYHINPIYTTYNPKPKCLVNI